MNFNIDRLAKEIGETVEDQLVKTGVIYRLFYRAKSVESIEQKQLIKKYSIEDGSKKMQDIVGIRITLYFADDVELIKETIKAKFDFIDETIDKTETTQFKPTRINLVFRLSQNHTKEFNEVVGPLYGFVDNTYEIQIRTVLSEGWHEVDHDLRYKCQEDWDRHEDLQRAFNGIFAGLETSDWSTLMIFDKLSYRHYKTGNWPAMIRTKFRLRFRNDDLDPKLIKILDNQPELAKRLFRIDRHLLLKELILRDLLIPFTLSNVVFISNCIFLREEVIYEVTPRPLLENKQLNTLLILDD